MEEQRELAGDRRPKKGRARTKKVAAVVAVVLLAAASVAYVVFRREDARQRQAREAAFADLSQCLLGEIVADGQQAAASMTWVRVRGARLEDSVRWPEAGVPWTKRCESHGRELVRAIDESSLWSSEARSAVRMPAFLLSVKLGEPEPEKADLGAYVETLWREAGKNGLHPAERSDVHGPPRAELERADQLLSSLELPFADFTPAPDGPRWHFFARLKDEPDKIASCAPSQEGLRCSKYTADPELLEYRKQPKKPFGHRLLFPPRFKPRGSWESPAYVQHAYWERLTPGLAGLVHEGKLEIWGDGKHFQHVDSSGTLYWTDGDRSVDRLYIKAPGAEPVAYSLVKMLEPSVKDPVTTAKTAILVGHGLAVTVADGAAKHRKWFPILQGAGLGTPVEIPHGEMCRAGSHYAVLGDNTLSFVDAATMVTAASFASDAKEIARCSASGTVATSDGYVCRALPPRCVRLYDVTHVESVGDRLFYLSDTHRGLVVNVGASGFSAATEEVVAIGRTALPLGYFDPYPQVFGDERVGLIIGELGEGLMGLGVTTSGEVGPVRIQWE